MRLYEYSVLPSVLQVLKKLIDSSTDRSEVELGKIAQIIDVCRFGLWCSPTKIPATEEFSNTQEPMYSDQLPVWNSLQAVKNIHYNESYKLC